MFIDDESDYVTVAGQKPRSAEDAEYFVEWMDRVMGWLGGIVFGIRRRRKRCVETIGVAKAIYEGMR